MLYNPGRFASIAVVICFQLFELQANFGTCGYYKSAGKMGKASQALILFVGVWVVSQSLVVTPVKAQLTPSFYANSCPKLFPIVGQHVLAAIQNESRIAASLLRLHFHDCFVQGCDASILLDGVGNEKDSRPNLNSARGFEVIDTIKAAVEKACPNVVSCADILTLASFFSIVVSGGPAWPVPLGRRDSLGPNFGLTVNLPGPALNVSGLKDKFAIQGLDTTDLVALSGGHTIGLARCATFSNRLFNFSNGQPDPTIDKTFLAALQKKCPTNGDGNVTLPLDSQTATVFDNLYFKDIVARKGLLNSDQVLLTGAADTRALVVAYANDQTQFFKAFANSMLKMGNLNPLTGNQGQIRKNCRVVNPTKSSSVLQAGGDFGSNLKLLVDQMSADAKEFVTRVVKQVMVELVAEGGEGEEPLIKNVVRSRRSAMYERLGSSSPTEN